MISFIEGLLDHAQPTFAVLNAGGVGYELLIPISSYEKLPPPGQKCRLLKLDAPAHGLPRQFQSDGGSRQQPK